MTEFSRRGFIASAAAAGLAPLPAVAAGQAVAFVVAGNDAVANSAPAVWAADRLRDVLAARGASVRTVRTPGEAAPGELRLIVAGGEAAAARDAMARLGAVLPPGPEALAVLGGNLDERDTMVAVGRDARGLAYALAELADRVVTSPGADPTLGFGAALLQRPANRVRSVARFFSSEVQDSAWLHDRAFWGEYLTVLADNRVNRFSLNFGQSVGAWSEPGDVYLAFAYPFLLAVPNYEVRVRGLPDDARERNLASLKFIAAETARRGLAFQLGLWSHGLAFEDPHANYAIEGVTPDIHAAYCSDALTLLLAEVGEIGGITVRTGDVGDEAFWRTVFRGIRRAGRPITIDLALGVEEAASGGVATDVGAVDGGATDRRASDGRVAAGGATDRRAADGRAAVGRAAAGGATDGGATDGGATDRRASGQAMIDVALETGLPVTISPGLLGEHAGLPYHAAGGSHGYGDLLREGRKYDVVWRIWPGTQRVLASGDATFLAGYSRAAGFCGGAGLEVCEPLSLRGSRGSGRSGDRAGYADASLRPARDFQKSALFYRLWGRLAYDPAAPAESWQRAFAQMFGPGGAPMEAALGRASRILPLVAQALAPSQRCDMYWPEMDSNRSVPDGFGAVPSYDPRLFASVGESADALTRGLPEARITSIDVANWLDALSGAAAAQLDAARRATPAPGVDFRRVAVDVEILAALGRFFAAKLRAAVLWSVFRASGAPEAAGEAVRLYRAARDRWAEAGRLAGVYVGDLAFGPEPWLRGHWRERLAAVDADVAEMARRAGDTAGPRTVGRERVWAALGQVLATAERPRLALRHIAPSRFEPGRAVPLVVAGDALLGVRLHYRRVNQAEAWQVADMTADAGRFAAEIPAGYTASTPYPLQYYLEWRQQDAAGLHPGFAADLANQPYYVARATRS